MAPQTAHGPRRARIIPQGQWVAPRFAAEAYIGRNYVIESSTGTFSANPADYWDWPDVSPIGEIVRNRHPYRTTTGRVIYDLRVIKSNGTIGDLRRLARAAESLVR